MNLTSIFRRALLLIQSLSFLLCFCLSCTSHNKESYSAYTDKTTILGVEIKEYHQSTSDYEIHCQIGQINEARSEHTLINKSITNKITEHIQEFRKKALRNCNRDVENSPQKPVLTIDFKVFENSDTLLSIRFRVHIIWSEMGMPTTYFIPINMNKQTAQSYTVNDFIATYFHSESSALQYLHSVCKEQFSNDIEKSCSSFWKTLQPKDVYENINFSSKGVYIIFDDYALDTHYCGNPEVYLPYSTIKETSF